MTVSSTYNRLTSSEERLEVQLRGYMQQDLVNKIIEWKRSNLSHVDNYERFLYELFPENIKTETKETKADSEKRRMARRQSSFSGKHVIWIDHRVDNNEWKEMFAQVQADDEIKALGLPPGLEDDGDDLLCNANSNDHQEVKITASELDTMSVWGKAKLAWQLGVAEVGNINVASLSTVSANATAAVTGLGSIGTNIGISQSASWSLPYSITLSPINSDSDSDSNSNGSSDNRSRAHSSSSGDGDTSDEDVEDDSFNVREIRELVIAFYTHHNPTKLGNVDQIMAKYAGKETQLVKNWEKKYGTNVREQQWFHDLRSQQRELST